MVMDWDFFRMVGALGLLSLVFLGIAERVGNREWQGLRQPTPAWRILVEWAVYMSVFVIFSLILQQIWRLMCSVCQ